MTLLTGHIEEKTLFTVTIPPTGVGFLSYAPVGGTVRTKTEPRELIKNIKLNGYVKERAKLRRSSSRIKKDLDTLLFSLEQPPTIEAFFRFDFSTPRHCWYRESGVWDEEQQELVPAEGGPRWILDLRGKARLKDVFQPFRMRLKRRYPEGWFIYRWRLKFSAATFGMPVLSLHLLGEPGPGHTFEDVAEHLRTAWLEILGSKADGLVTVQEPHELSASNFSARTDSRLTEDLARILRGQYEYGKINRGAIKTKPPIKATVSAEVMETITALLAQHHERYCEANGRETTPSYLRMLQASYGRAFLNPEIAAEVLALLHPR